MKNKLFTAGLALCALLPLALGTNGLHAQSYSASAMAPSIDGFDVEPVRQPQPGSELLFTLYGSPGGSAVVKIAGATGDLPLVETEAGVYEGTYTIRRRDRITANSAATANLRVGNRVATAILDEPVIGVPGAKRPPPARTSGAPKIDRFDIDAPSRLAAGEELIIFVNGSPAAAASAKIPGVKGKLLLTEVRTGVYEGRYTIKNRDRISNEAAATATLRLNGQDTTLALGHAISARTGAQSSSPARNAVAACANCGVIEAINLVEVKGEGTYLGKIGGGIAGALLGSQIGQGRGTTVAEVAGAAGGYFAGNEIEKRMKATKHYEVLVRLENGGTQTVSYATQPALAVGARVRIESGTLVAR